MKESHKILLINCVVTIVSVLAALKINEYINKTKVAPPEKISAS